MNDDVLQELRDGYFGKQRLLQPMRCCGDEAACTAAAQTEKWWIPLVIVAACLISVSSQVSVVASAGVRAAEKAHVESLWADQYNAGSYAMSAEKTENAELPEELDYLLRVYAP